MRYLITLLISCFLLNAQTLKDDSYFDDHLKDAIKTIATKSEKIGLDKIRLLIKENPRKFNNSYHKLFLDPSQSKYLNLIKKYARLVDIETFREVANKGGNIDKLMQDSAITYVFFSSKREFMDEIGIFTNGFKVLLYSSMQNLTKTNKELLALFKANYLLGINKDVKAYKILKQNRPYHTKSLQTISYFSSIKDIPLYKDRERLLKAIGSKKLKLKDPTFDHSPKFLFDTNGDKIHINYITKKEMELILNIIHKKARNDMFQIPPNKFNISPLYVRSQGDFAYVQAIPIFEDGTYISTKYITDEVYNLCFKKEDGRWKLIYELTRNDVPSKEQLAEIQKTFPKTFPKRILSKFWRNIL